VPLDEQDRSRWDQELIREGIALISSTLGTARAGPYQLQAAIAAVHDEAADAADTDWPQIKALYDVLDRIDPGPVVTLNRAVAVAMVAGPRAGLALLGTLDGDDRMVRNHRLHAVRAHLLELAGDPVGARSAYQRAAMLTASLPEQRYLMLRAAALPAPRPSSDGVIHSRRSAGTCRLCSLREAQPSRPTPHCSYRAAH